MDRNINHDIRNYLFDAVLKSPRKIPSAELIRDATRQFGACTRSVRKTIRDMARDGDVVFTYEHGHSFLVRSMGRPVRLSAGVVLVPPRMSYTPAGSEIAIRIAPGASFGAGDHPSTQLALQGLESIMRPAQLKKSRPRTRVLDIGTGSGILSIAALGMGAGHALGLDIDPCARHEAKLNADINEMSDRLEVRADAVERLGGEFDLIMANLMYPTLVNLHPAISNLIRPAGAVVLSGMKSNEIHNLASLYTKQQRFSRHWQAEKLGWSCLVLLAAGI